MHWMHTSAENCRSCSALKHLATVYRALLGGLTFVDERAELSLRGSHTFEPSLPRRWGPMRERAPLDSRDPAPGPHRRGEGTLNRYTGPSQ